MPVCLSDMQMFLMPRSCLVSVGGAAFWLTKTFSLFPPYQGRVWLGSRNCRRAVFLELQQAIVWDISFFFSPLQAYLTNDKETALCSVSKALITLLSSSATVPQMCVWLCSLWVQQVSASRSRSMVALKATSSALLVLLCVPIHLFTLTASRR